MEQTAALKNGAKIHEHDVLDPTTGDGFISLAIGKEDIARVELDQRVPGMPWMGVDGEGKGAGGANDLKLVPYYFRANRGGRGMMRVGFARAS